jgi:hypothetical protein
MQEEKDQTCQFRLSHSILLADSLLFVSGLADLSFGLYVRLFLADLILPFVGDRATWNRLRWSSNK